MSERLLVGVEFTAQELRIALAEPRGERIAREEWPLPTISDDEAWAWEVGGRIATTFAEKGDGRSGLAIAVAAPGPVDPIAGRLLRGGQSEWEGLAVVESLRRHVDMPIAVESRIRAALLGEQVEGAARGADSVLYLSLRGEPEAAILIGGRTVRGAQGEAGVLSAVPDIDHEQHLGGAALESIAAPLADAAVLLDPQLVVVDALPRHLETLIPVLRQMIGQVSPNPRVKAAGLGADAPLAGALQIAATLAYEAGSEA